MKWASSLYQQGPRVQKTVQRKSRRADSIHVTSTTHTQILKGLESSFSPPCAPICTQNDAISLGNRQSLNTSFIWLLHENVLGSFKRTPKSRIHYFKTHLQPRGGNSAQPPPGIIKTYCCHAADLIQSQLQELLVAALRHQLEGRLLQAVRTPEHQASDVSDTLKGDGGGLQDERGKGTEEGEEEEEQ